MHGTSILRYASDRASVAQSAARLVIRRSRVDPRRVRQHSSVEIDH